MNFTAKNAMVLVNIIYLQQIKLFALTSQSVSLRETIMFAKGVESTLG